MDDVIYTDDAREMGELIKSEWSLGFGNEAPIVYDTEALMVDSRVGNIYIYTSSRDYSISSVDYQTINRIAHVGIRVSNRFRDANLLWSNEVYRILMENRRAGARKLWGYTYFDVQSDRMSNDANGWYVRTFDVKLTGNYTPIGPSGFNSPLCRRFSVDNL